MVETATNTVPLWVTLIGFAAPLLALAGSAVAYVVKLFQDAAGKRRDRLFELMDIIDSRGTIAKKVTAVYELRQFPKHKDFIIRFCSTQIDNIEGPGMGVSILRDEMKRTQEYMESLP